MIGVVQSFHYNLACKECLLGNLEEAKSRSKRMIELEARYRITALEDRDLEALWASLGWL